MNDESMTAQYLASPLVNLFEPENTNQFKLKNDPNSIRMNDFFRNGVTVSLFSNMLTFRDSYQSFKLDGDLLTMGAILIQKIKNKFFSLEKKWILILNRKDENVLEMKLL